MLRGRADVRIHDQQGSSRQDFTRLIIYNFSGNGMGILGNQQICREK
jgi:hypothetical protein